MWDSIEAGSVCEHVVKNVGRGVGVSAKELEMVFLSAVTPFAEDGSH